MRESAHKQRRAAATGRTGWISSLGAIASAPATVDADFSQITKGKKVMTDMITGWLQRVQGTVPPFVVEIVLRDGSHYFLHHFSTDDSESKTIVLGIWDFRALSETGIVQLKERLNEPFPGSESGDIEALNLDWANLRVPYDEIAYCIEWHDRHWPEERRPKLGFRA